MSKLCAKLYTKAVKFFTAKEEGASLVEYGLLVGLIAAICVVAVTTIGTKISTLFTTTAAALPGGS